MDLEKIYITGSKTQCFRLHPLCLHTLTPKKETSKEIQNSHRHAGMSYQGVQARKSMTDFDFDLV